MTPETPSSSPDPVEINPNNSLDEHRPAIAEPGAHGREVPDQAAPRPRPWFWYAGRDDEVCNVGPCATRDEAVELALADGIYTEIDPDAEHPEWRVSIYVVEATKHQLEDIEISDADRILEHLSDDRYYDWLSPDGDGSLFDYTPAQERDLSARLTAALHEWARSHNLTPDTFMFRDMRNDEWVTLPHPDNKSPDFAKPIITPGDR